MKVRTGFVSNSSSSSFLIAFKSENPCSLCGHIKDNILDKITSSCDEDTYLISDDLEEVLKQVLPYNNPTVKERIIAASKNKTVALISVSYHDEEINDMLNNDPNVEVISNDEREDWDINED